MKRGLKTIRILLLLVGLVLIANFSLVSITGNVINGNIQVGGSILGFIFVIGGIALFLKGEESKLVSLVKEDPILLKIAKSIEGKQDIQKDINHLLRELGKGNEDPGVGTKKLFGDIKYLRGFQGARVFYRPSGEDKYEVLGYAVGQGVEGGKKPYSSEARAVSRLKKLYEGKEQKAEAA